MRAGVFSGSFFFEWKINITYALFLHRLFHFLLSFSLSSQKFDSITRGVKKHYELAARRVKHEGAPLRRRELVGCITRGCEIYFSLNMKSITERSHSSEKGAHRLERGEEVYMYTPGCGAEIRMKGKIIALNFKRADGSFALLAWLDSIYICSAF